VPKVGDSLGRARAALHGVSWQGFNDNGLDAHAGRSALQSLRDVHVYWPLSGVLAAAGTDSDKSSTSTTTTTSSLRHNETGSK